MLHPEVQYSYPYCPVHVRSYSITTHHIRTSTRTILLVYLHPMQRLSATVPFHPWPHIPLSLMSSNRTYAGRRHHCTSRSSLFLNWLAHFSSAVEILRGIRFPSSGQLEEKQPRRSNFATRQHRLTVAHESWGSRPISRVATSSLVSLHQSRAVQGRWSSRELIFDSDNVDPNAAR